MQESKAIGQELIQGIPDEKQGWQVSEADTHKIAKILGIWWEVFAAKLHFDKSEVDNIKTQYIHDLEMQKYQLLLRWNYRNGSKATYGVILNHLCDLEQIDCLDEVCKLLHAQSEPGPPLLSALARYSDDLKCAYSNHQYQTVVDWPPPLHENFMRLAMISEQGVRKGEMDPQFIGQITQGNVENILRSKTEIQLHEIFDKTKGNVVLLEGAPGSGKTTLCWYICQEWGRGRLFQQFTHVLMVELRDEHTQSADHLADILPYCEGEEADKIAEELKEKNGKNVLLILEGWDELHEKKRKKSIFKRLIEKGARCPLHKAVILISSRSSVSAGLAKTRVEILGFTPDQISQYVQESCGQEDEKAAGLLTTIRQNPKLQGTCYFPLNLMLIVHLYSIDQKLPESFCSIIIQLVLTCLYHYRRNKFDLDDDFESFDELPDDIKPQFLELCKLAFEATMEERHSFSNLKTDHLGLMQSVQSIAPRGNKITQYFLHSSLQELCAAIHISTQPIPEQQRMLKMIFVAPKDYVLRFYSALTHWENASLCEVLFEHSETIIKTTNIYFTKPKPFSQEILPPMLTNMKIHGFQDTLIEERPLDRNKLASMVFLPSLEPALHEAMAVSQRQVMKILDIDTSFNPDEWMKETGEQITNVVMSHLSPAQGRYGECIKGTFKAQMEMIITCHQGMSQSIE